MFIIQVSFHAGLMAMNKADSVCLHQRKNMPLGFLLDPIEFNILISELDGDREGMTTKLCSTQCSPKWAEANENKLNLNKCSILHKLTLKVQDVDFQFKIVNRGVTG